jgi:GNAT superfamily N-acetyltransferase
MERLAPGRDLLDRYDRSGAHDFAIIRCAVEGLQDGFALTAGGLTFITHASGFSQIIGQVGDVDQVDQLIRAWRAHSDVAGRYVMLYDMPPALAQAFERQTPAHFRSRERFVFRGWEQGGIPAASAIEGAEVKGLNAAEALGLNLSGRFWRSGADLLKHGIATLVTHNGEPASICYSAAVSNNIHEVDVLTTGSMRGKGLGRSAALAFMQRCKETGAKPNWDCFTANAPSMALAKACGLRHIHTYQLITFTA